MLLLREWSGFVRSVTPTRLKPHHGEALRQIVDHIINPANDQIQILVTDEPNAGGANHRYEVTGFKTGTNVSLSERDPDAKSKIVLLFQNGPINEVSVNGVTQEVLLTIVADRLRSFQTGPYSCKENACALTKIEEVQHWLQQRTIARM
jgi:hypothetical protein